MELSKLMGCVKRPFIPSELFRGGLIDGAWFDPSDLSTLYQDAAGTIPVTAVEQPVGLMLDKARGLMLGPEKISDVDFDNASSWVVDAGFVVSGGKLTINNSVAGNCYQTSTNITSKVFSVTIKIDSLSSGYFLARLCGQNGIALNSAGVYKFLLRSGTINSFIGVQAAPNTVAVIDSISVREIYGYHATQPITASRPVLSARYNLLTKTEDFSDAVWTNNGVSITTSRYLSPIGTFTANKATLVSGAVTTGSDGVGAFASPSITANGSAYTLSLFAKSAGSNYIRFREATNTGQRVKINLIDGSFVGEANWSPSTFTVTVTPAPNGFFLIQITRSAPTTFCFNIKGGDDVGDGINGFYVWGADLRLSTTSGPYQRVNTATDYDTDERYFKKYLRFDGVDDYLNLPYMGLYANGSASVVAAIDEPPSLSANQTIFAEGNSLNTTPAYSLVRRLTSGVGGSSVADTGGTNFSYTSPFISTPNTVESFIDAGNSFSFYRKSALIGGATKTTATTTLNNTTIGAINRGGVVQLFSVLNLYGLIITKSALTDSQRVACERFEARKSGVLM